MSNYSYEPDSDEDDVEIRSVSTDDSQSVTGDESPDSRSSDGDDSFALLFDDDEEAFSRDDIQPAVTSPSSRSSAASDNNDDDGRRSPMSSDDEEESMNGYESPGSGSSDGDQRSEVSPDDDEFSRGSVLSDVDNDDGHRSPMSTGDEEESVYDGMEAEEIEQPPSDDDGDDVDEGFLPPQTLDESLRSQLRCALNALAERDATIQDLQNRLDESEAARTELQTTVGRLEVTVEGLDADVQRWYGIAQDADGQLRDVEAERNALREGRDRLMDDRRHETEARETLEEALLARQDEMDHSAERQREELDQSDRRIDDLIGEVEGYQKRITELEDENLRLRSRVYAQHLLDLTIRVEDTEYIQNPNDVVAYISKAGMIAFFRKFVVGKRRSREDTDDLAAQLSAEALDLVGVREEYHVEMLDVLTKVAKGIFRERDKNAIKRRRIEE